MATAKQLLLTFLDYSAWANQQLLNLCGSLTVEEQERDLGASHRSIAATLRHSFYAERVWRQRLLADAVPPMIQVGNQSLFRDPDPEPGIDALSKAWPEVSRSLREWLEGLEDADLDTELSFRYPGGETLSVSRAKLLLHSVNHSTLHRGQVLVMLRNLGKQPANIDIFSFYMHS